MNSTTLFFQFILLNELLDGLHPDDEKLRKVLVGMAKLPGKKELKLQTHVPTKETQYG